VGVARIEKPQNFLRVSDFDPMRTRAGISTSDIHFIISKTVSAVRADATEVPCPRQNPLAQTVYPLQGRKVDPNFENNNKFSGKKFLLASSTTRKIC